jgi:hypothetical protein
MVYSAGISGSVARFPSRAAYVEVPLGTTDTSPPFQRWVPGNKKSSRQAEAVWRVYAQAN